MSEKIKMIFQVEVDKELLCGDEILNSEHFKGSWFNYLKWLYDEEGVWWNEPLELIGVKE